MVPCVAKNVIPSFLFLLLYAANAFRFSRNGVGNVSSFPSRSRSLPIRLRSSSRPLSAPRQRPRKQKWRDAYKVLKEIGAGAYGKAYLVERIGNPSKRKVVKEVEYDKYDSIEDEVMNLKLPFIADIEEKFIEGKEKVSLLTRYYEGGDLFDHMTTTGTLNATQVKFWGSQMASGLWHLHRSQVLYADMKLENTFITKGNVVLADFGLSTLPCPNQRGWACETQAKGTPDYVTASILEGGPYGFEIDWWALGVTLFMMQEGSFLFPGKDGDAVMKNIKRRKLKLKSRSRSPESELVQFLENILNNEAFKDLETDKARAQMVDKASVHPILRHPYWHGETDPEKIDQYWSAFCLKYAIHKEHCKEVAGPPAWVREHPAADVKPTKVSDGSADDAVIHLTCVGVECSPHSRDGVTLKGGRVDLSV